MSPAPSHAGAEDRPFWYPAVDEQAAVAQVIETFRGRFGHAPDGVWAAPGRVNLIGEHVDYNGGRCLPFALPQRTYAAVQLTGDDKVDVASAQVDGAWSGSLAQVRPGAVGPWAGYVVGVPWALRQAGFAVPGLRAVVTSQVPLGAGLSSSAALECAIAVAVDELAGLGLADDDPGRRRLAAACVRAENDIAGAPTGGMDQAAALRALPGHALLLDCDDFSAEQLPLDLTAAGLEVLVIDTRAHHALVDGQYGSRRAVCEAAAAALGVPSLGALMPSRTADPGVPTDAILDPAIARLPQDEWRRRVRHVLTEIARVDAVARVLATGSPEAIGPLLDASHRSLRDDYEVSCPELDLAVETARAAGALGARMIGGGFGGSAIALIRAGTGGPVAGAVAHAFCEARMAPPAFLVAVPSGPAGRVG